MEALSAADDMVVPMSYNQKGATAIEGDRDDVGTIDTDKLGYEIFSILESKFLFGYDDDHNLWLPPKPTTTVETDPSVVDDVKTQRGKIRFLSIDGGGGVGMRGILPAKSLSCLELSLRSKSGYPNTTISDYFDVVAGTGVGGLFASVLDLLHSKRRVPPTLHRKRHVAIPRRQRHASIPQAYVIVHDELRVRWWERDGVDGEGDEGGARGEVDAKGHGETAADCGREGEGGRREAGEGGGGRRERRGREVGQGSGRGRG